jgi:hypothetical protein
VSTRGRRSLLTDIVAQRIVAAVKKGATRDAAADHAGIARSTLQSWLQRGDSDEEPYADFARRVHEAQGAVLTEVHGIVLDMARDADLHPPTRLNACLNILKREVPATAPGAQTSPDASRDPVADLDVARSVVAALESRRVA